METGETGHLPISNRPLRVAYFAGTMRPGHDGVTRVLYRLIEGLERRGVDNMFFSPIVPPKSEQPTPMIEVPSVQFPLYKDYRFAVPGIRHFHDHLKSFQPDLLHINSPCSLGYAAVRYGQKFGIPVVATYHTHFASYAKYYKVKAIESVSWNYFRKLYNSCERVYVPSRPILEELHGHGMWGLEFLPHGVDTTVFSPCYRTPDWKTRLGLEGKTTLLFVGRLVWEKDLKTLAEAYRIVNARRNDAAFVLVGDGPIRSQLEEAMPGAVFLGQQSGAELSTSYASSDIFVFPSTTETFGNVIVEAMASGIPPICAREGGAYGNVENGLTGLLTRPRDPVDLAEKIEFLLDHPGKRSEMADIGREFALRQSWDHIIDRLLASYDDVIRTYRVNRFHHRKKAA